MAGRWAIYQGGHIVKEGTKPERRKWRVSSKNMGALDPCIKVQVSLAGTFSDDDATPAYFP